MSNIASNKCIVLVLIASIGLTGCASVVYRSTYGYVKDHPDPASIKDYEAVKTWAYDVSDGYSSRGTMNRYSLYFAGGLAAGGAGALGGLAATGYSGHASIIIPLTAAFLGTLFGYYQSEEKAQLYYAASDSIKALISQSEKRALLLSASSRPAQVSAADNPIIVGKTSGTESPTLCDLILKRGQSNQAVKSICEKLDKDLAVAKKDKEQQENSKLKIHQDAAKMGNPAQDSISALSKAIDVADAKISAANNTIDLANQHQQNLALLLASSKYNEYEANCLREDVDLVMSKVRVHLAKLDPQHVSEDLKNVKAAKDGDTPAAKPPAGNTPKSDVMQPSGFDLSDLDPRKITSVCDIGT